jgi:hypothetical protein
MSVDTDSDSKTVDSYHGSLSVGTPPSVASISNVTVPRDILDSLLQCDPTGYFARIGAAKTLLLLQNPQEYANSASAEYCELTHNGGTRTGSRKSGKFNPRSPEQPNRALIGERFGDGPAVGKTQRPSIYIETTSGHTSDLQPSSYDSQISSFTSQLERNPFGLLGYTPPLSATSHRSVTASWISRRPFHLPPLPQNTPPLSTCPAYYARIRHLNFPTRLPYLWSSMGDGIANPESLIPDFKFEKVLNQGMR